MNLTSDLISKYDIPAPRYTSYPTVPYWQDDPAPDQWLQAVRRALEPEDSSVAIYVHVPFCETLCSFCGCNTSITRNHEVEDPYIDILLKEYKHYRTQVPDLDRRVIKEFHWGGGSPTYLSPKNLTRLVEGILEHARIDENPEFSIEVDPRRCTDEQIKSLYELQFRRVSLGVQDFDPEVQRLINRNQAYTDAVRITELVRTMGYTSVNFDLIYGLPAQTPQTIADTIQKTVELLPDRIALYSYAHVPWIKAAQRLFTEDDLPRGADKRRLYEIAREKLALAGYREIGMDHFALESDPLWKAAMDGSLHRNFMGYTTRSTNLLLGLGASSISDSWDCFHQNEKVTKKYQNQIEATGQATLRGHMLNEEDLRIRGYILDIACRLRAELPAELARDVKEYLGEMEADGLVNWKDNVLQVSETGRACLRNICMGLDLRMRRQKPGARVFSQSI